MQTYQKLGDVVPQVMSGLPDWVNPREHVVLVVDLSRPDMRDIALHFGPEKDAQRALSNKDNDIYYTVVDFPFAQRHWKTPLPSPSATQIFLGYFPGKGKRIDTAILYAVPMPKGAKGGMSGPASGSGAMGFQWN